jgi:Mg2+-importing ATPase
VTAAKLREANVHLNAQGLRSLAVAYAAVPRRDRYTRDDERNLTLAGFLTFVDELLPDAKEVVAALKNDGIEIKVISGDNDLVTSRVCAQVGLDTGRVVLGDDMDRTTDPALGVISEQAHVFARISPAQKNRILVALKHRGHAVGYMGDGINDAPSLHAADVGISVASAVDVAREAADVILVEPGLRVLHDGIVEGRRAFANVMKYLLMGTSSNFGNVLSMAGASLFLPFLPMLPTQILLNNLLYDLAQITIPTDNVDDAFLKKPQQWNVVFIRKFMLVVGPVSSAFDAITFYVLLQMFGSDEASFHTGWFIESLATQVLVLFVIRTTGNPLQSRPSRPLVATCLAVVAVGAWLPFSPIADLLGFVPLPIEYFGFVALVTAAYLIAVEAVKRRLFGAAGDKGGTDGRPHVARGSPAARNG